MELMAGEVWKQEGVMQLWEAPKLEMGAEKWSASKNRDPNKALLME